MELKDAIKLINDENIYTHPANAVWADLGCGTGLFTYALANLMQPGGRLYAIDKSDTALTEYQNPHNIHIKQQQLNFISEELNLSGLDGILMANSLHFVKNKVALIHKLSNSLAASGGFMIVEYDTDSSNPWVPFPLSYSSLKKLFEDTGYSLVRKINERPSAFRTSKIYAAFISR